MSETPALSLPLILPDQAQKHVTHNEALARLDGLVQLALRSRSVSAPPEDAAPGDAWLCAGPATGDWSGHDDEVAILTAGGWRFHVPREGWRAWIADEAALAIRDVGGWRIVAGDGIERVGVNATADAVNRLSLRGEAVLFSAAGAPESGDIRVKLNREGDGDTASLVFQSGFSGRGEIGLAGSDDLSVKVSADGATWREAMRIDSATGAVALPSGVAMLRGLLFDETWAALAAMAGAPRRARSFLLDDTIAALIDAGLWAKLDILYLLAAHDADAAGVNIRAPRTYRLAASGAPAFEADHGFGGDAVAAMLATGFVPASAGGAMALDDAHVGLWKTGGAGSVGGAIGTPGATGGHVDINPEDAAGDAAARLNEAATLTAASAGGDGHWVATRRPGTGRALYRDGASVAADASAATALADAEMVLLASATGFSAAELAVAHAGAGLDAAEIAALGAILDAYLAAVGAV